MQRGSCKDRVRDQGYEATNQEMPGVSRNWEKQEKILSQSL